MNPDYSQYVSKSCRSAPLLEAISGSSDVLASGTAAKPILPVLSAAEDSSHVDENTLATDDQESAPAASAESQVQELVLGTVHSSASLSFSLVTIKDCVSNIGKSRCCVQRKFSI